MAATARSLATLVMMISPSSLNPRPRPGDATHPDHVPSLRSKSGEPNDVPRKKKGGAPLAKSRLPRVFGVQPWSKEKMLDGGSGLSLEKIRTAAAKSPFAATFLVGSTEQGNLRAYQRYNEVGRRAVACHRMIATW
jgi:hypothetical protein